jgi:hypothetical protein
MRKFIGSVKGIQRAGRFWKVQMHLINKQSGERAEIGD